MGGPYSRWLTLILGSLSGGTILMTTSLGQGMPLYSSRRFREKDILFKTASA
jgi:hypothetical protein